MLSLEDSEAIAQLVRNQVADILRRHRSLARRVYITGTDDGGKVRLVQTSGIAGQVNDGVEHFEPFGFSSNPPAGQPPNCAEGIKIEIGGNPAHPVLIVGFDRRFRPVGLQPGESVVFNQWGDFVKLDEARNITVNAGANVKISAAAKVTVTAPNAEFTGNVKVDGNLNIGKIFTASSSASFTKGKVTVAAGAQLLVVTAGDLKVAGISVNAP